MNKEDIKKALNKASYISSNWKQYTFEDLQDEMCELNLLSTKAIQELDTTLIRISKSYKYIISQAEKNFVESKGIKKGDLIKVITYFPEKDNYKSGSLYFGVYKGLEVDRFDSVTYDPIYRIKLHNKWTTGTNIAADKYPYPWIPNIEFNGNCEFNPIKDNIHCYNELFSVTDKEKESYRSVLLKYVEYQK